MNLTNKKIGIWGFGILGKSALAYFQRTAACSIEVIDTKPLAEEDCQFLARHNVSQLRQPDDLTRFLENNEVILPSSGIDLRPYKNYAHKWITELDLFYANFGKPIVAITGTVGKTSTTQLLGQLIQASDQPFAIGGNIGVGLFDLLADTTNTGAVIELSSFQLELATNFAPDLAIWTNFYPNHLDRHNNQQEYFDAKYRIIRHQKPHQQALLPLSLLPTIRSTHPTHSTISWFCAQMPTHTELNALHAHEQLYYFTATHLMKYTQGAHVTLLALHELPQISFAQNWLIMCAALDMLNIPLQVLQKVHATLAVPEHRLEKVATINTVAFYNDSKSTTAEATLAAVQQLAGKPIHLFLGGLGKGVDRTPLIQQLHGKAAHIYCFGKEADQLHTICQQNTVASSCHTTLEDAFEQCKKQVRPHEQVLLSPAGASFDLFKDYKERGRRFKELVESATLKDL